MFDGFTEEAKRAIQIARECANKGGAGFFEDVHILIGCCRAPGSLAARVLLGCGHDPSEVCGRAEARAASLPKRRGSQDQLPFTPQAMQAFESALQEAAALEHTSVGTDHILLALLQLDSPLGEVLRKSGLKRAEARRVTLEIDRRPEPAPSPADSGARVDPRLETLSAAERVCVELREFELASRLRDLAHRIESGL